MGKYQAYPEYPEYKDTGIDWLPKVPTCWQVLPVKLVLMNKVKDGPHETPVFIEEGVPFLSVDGIQDGKLVFEGCRYISQEDHERYSKKCLPKYGDILLGKAASVGKVAFVDTEQEFNVWSPLAVLTPKTVKFGRFLYYSLQSTWLQAQCDVSSNSNTQKNLSMGVIDNLLFPIPIDDVAEEISNFLDHETAKIDTLIDKQQQLIQLLKEKRQAVISHAVTKGLNPNAPMRDSGVKWLGKVPEHWGVVKLSHRYEVLLGKMLDDKKITGTYLGAYLQWHGINTENLPLMDFRPEERDRYSVKKGDLIVCEGGDIGRSAIWDQEEDCFYQKALHRLRPHDSARDSTKFMLYVMFDAVHQERFSGGVAKATIAHLPAETFRQYRFAYPPYDEQLEISAYLDEMSSKFEAIESSAQRQVELLKERRTALISAAVTGKIDVRGFNLAHEHKDASA